MVSKLGQMLARRSQDQFPPDSHGDVLWMLCKHGVDISMPRQLEFHLVFSHVADGQQFQQAANELLYEFETVLDRHQPPHSGCTVTCIAELVPNHEVVSRYYDVLDDLARAHSGEAEGWGTLVDTD